MRLLAFALALFGAVSGASAAIDVTVEIKACEQVECDYPSFQGKPLIRERLGFVFTVASSFEVATLVASVDGTTWPLAVSPRGVTSIDVHALGRGAKTLTITATDINGAHGSASADFFFDTVPVVTLTPNFGAVVAGSFAVEATCHDDDPEGCLRLRIGARYGPNGPITTIASGAAAAGGTVQVPANLPNGSAIIVNVDASDSIDTTGTTITLSRTFHLERSASLQLLLNVVATSSTSTTSGCSCAQRMDSWPCNSETGWMTLPCSPLASRTRC